MQHNGFQILWYLWQIKNRSSTRIIHQMAHQRMADILFFFRIFFINLSWSLHHKYCQHPLYVVWLKNGSTRYVVPFFHCWSQYGERVCWLLTNQSWSWQQHERWRCQQRWGWLCWNHCCWYRSHEARTGGTTTVTHYQYQYGGLPHHCSCECIAFEEEEETQDRIADVDESNHWDCQSPYSNHEPLVHLLHSKCTFSRPPFPLQVPPTTSITIYWLSEAFSWARGKKRGSTVVDWCHWWTWQTIDANRSPCPHGSSLQWTSMDTRRLIRECL